MAGALLTAAVLLLQSAGDAVDPEQAIEAELAGLDQAWRAGAFEDAYAHAREAVTLIDASSCPLRSDAAVAAALGGLSARAGSLGSGGFLFWIADQVDRRLSVLPGPIPSLVHGQRIEPGERPGLDDDFLRSAYLDPDALTPGCAEPQLDPDIFFAEPASAEAVLIAVRWPRDYSEPLWRRAELLFAYPGGEGRDLFEQLREQRSTFSVNRGVDIRVFDPCLALPGPDYAYFEICREGAAP